MAAADRRSTSHRGPTWGPTAVVQSVRPRKHTSVVTLTDPRGRLREIELNVLPDPAGAVAALDGRRPLAVLVVVMGHVLNCGVLVSDRGRSDRLSLTLAQALALAADGVRCVFRR